MSLKNLAAAAAVLSASVALPAPAQAGTEPYIGEIIAYGFDFCPRGFLPANGQLLSIAQNSALFSLLGTTYGGNGRDTFGLPDLRSRVVVGQGSNASGSYPLGARDGAEGFLVVPSTMAPHTHAAALRAVGNASGTTNDPTDNSVGRASTGYNIYSTADPNVDMNAGDAVINSTGSAVPASVPLTSPALTMNYCIATQGVFPSRT